MPWVSVDDIPASAAAGVESGGEIMHPAMATSESEREWICVVRDRSGAYVGLIQKAVPDSEL